MQIEELKSNIINHETKFEIENLDIITYLSAPNFINSCNQHVGKVYRLFPEITKPEVVNQILTKLAWLQKIPMIGAKLKENSFLLDGLLSIIGHRLPPLLDSFDPSIGKPIKCEEILDWPTIKYNPNLAKVKETEKGFIKGLLNAIPYSNMVPDFMKSAASSVICKAIPDNALMGLLNILIELINGNIKSDQYFTTYKYLESSSNKEGYNVKVNLSDRQEFSLSYEGHYRTKPLNPSRDVMATSNRGSSDWYLSQLTKLSVKKIEEKAIPTLLKQQLIAIKEQYTIDPEGKKYLCTKSVNIKADDVRQNLMRLIEISPAVKEILEDKYAHAIKPANISGVFTSNLPAMSISNFIHRENIFEQIDKALSVNHQLAIDVTQV
ncbi:hypothetical protein [Rickettsia endosymbiont of Orchestes rusci]|uniref:hypothetical protein n=1 Tax=Rickettsia endosymbiont of Orchestes rusci TaxID=3066250 RepID=UPI00313E4DA3